jgi:plastocyanin
MVSIALGKPTATDSSGFMFVDSVSKTSVTTIKKGTMVTWTNPTKAPHTVTADDGSFDSGTFDPGKTFSMTFTAVGKFKYSCDVHPGQVGEVDVTA